MKGTKPGLKGLTNEPEIRRYIVEIIGQGEVSAITIMMYCHLEFGTTDNQARALLIYMLRDGELVLNDWGEYSAIRPHFFGPVYPFQASGQPPASVTGSPALSNDDETWAAGQAYARSVLDSWNKNADPFRPLPDEFYDNDDYDSPRKPGPDGLTDWERTQLSGIADWIIDNDVWVDDEGNSYTNTEEEDDDDDDGYDEWGWLGGFNY